MDKVRELLVVEGKHDKDKLERLFDCDIICTNGLGVDDDTMKTIRTCALNQGVIVLTDPDRPGEKIRRFRKPGMSSFPADRPSASATSASNMSMMKC